jgi:hypothetical protein
MFFGFKNFIRALIGLAVLVASNVVAAASINIFETVSGSFTKDYSFTLTSASNVAAGLSNVFVSLGPIDINKISGFAASIVSVGGNTQLAVLSTSNGSAAGFNFSTLTFNSPTIFNPGSYLLRVGGNTGSSNTQATFSGFLETTAVPVPAAAWLLGSALIGLTGISRRRS